MQAEFKIIDRASGKVEFISSFTEPTQTRKGEPITNLKVVKIWVEAAPLGTYVAMDAPASSPNGGESRTVRNFISLLPNQVTHVKLWCMAVNTDDQESDSSPVHEEDVSTNELDPMNAPMPPS